MGEGGGEVEGDTDMSHIDDELPRCKNCQCIYSLTQLDSVTGICEECWEDLNIWYIPLPVELPQENTQN